MLTVTADTSVAAFSEASCLRMEQVAGLIISARRESDAPLAQRLEILALADPASVRRVEALHRISLVARAERQELADRIWDEGLMQTLGSLLS